MHKLCIMEMLTFAAFQNEKFSFPERKNSVGPLGHWAVGPLSLYGMIALSSSLAPAQAQWANPGWSHKKDPTFGSLTGATTVVAGGTVNLEIVASDYDTNPNGKRESDTLYYHWSCSGGSLNRSTAGTDSADTAQWKAPTTTGTYAVAVTVNDTGYKNQYQTGQDGDILQGRRRKDHRNDGWAKKKISIRVVPASLGNRRVELSRSGRHEFSKIESGVRVTTGDTTYSYTIHQSIAVPSYRPNNIRVQGYDIGDDWSANLKSTWHQSGSGLESPYDELKSTHRC